MMNDQKDDIKNQSPPLNFDQLKKQLKGVDVDDTHINAFILYLDQNGFEFEDIKEELIDTDPTESTLIDFFDEINDKLMLTKVIKIIKPKRNMIKSFVDGLNWSVTPQQMNQLKVNMSKYYSAIYEECENDQSVLQMFAYGYINHQYPLFNNIIDGYLRSRIITKKYDDYQIEDYIANAPIMKQIKQVKSFNLSSTNHPIHFCKEAMYLYIKRIVPQLMFNCCTKIQEDIFRVAIFIEACILIVCNHQIAADSTIPFQIDFMIPMRNVKNIYDDQSDCDSDDDITDDDNKDDGKSDKDDDSDTDTASESDDSSVSVKLLSMNTNIDVIGDVCEKLKKTKCEQIAVYSTKQKVASWPRAVSWGIQQISNKQKRQRICCFAEKLFDDDGGHKDDNKKNCWKGIVFRPPDDCNQLPSADVLHIGHLNNLKTCLIPKKGYKVGMNNNVNNDDADIKNQNITVNSSCKGHLITLSFIVESAELIKCYLCINGQISRFMPTDIIDVLPLFFDMNYMENSQFITTHELKKMLSTSHVKMFVDTELEKFLSKK